MRQLALSSVAPELIVAPFRLVVKVWAVVVISARVYGYHLFKATVCVPGQLLSCALAVILLQHKLILLLLCTVNGCHDHRFYTF
jgi:hypothetical protein